MREWKSVGKEEEEGEEDVIYYPLFGKAAYVDHHVYTFGYQNLLMAYSVGLSADGIVQSLGAPIFFPPLPFLPLPPKSVPELGGGFAHLGSKIFCMMKTGSGVRHSNIQSVQSPNIQIVSILIGRVYGKMQFETLHALICALDMEENLGDANITSLCLDSQQSKYAYNADFWKGGPKVLPNKLFEEPYQPKPESVPEGSQAARKRIDMHDLVDLTDDDLKDLGLPEGSSKEILLALGD